MYFYRDFVLSLKDKPILKSKRYNCCNEKRYKTENSAYFVSSYSLSLLLNFFISVLGHWLLQAWIKNAFMQNKWYHKQNSIIWKLCRLCIMAIFAEFIISFIHLVV